jgi:molybdate transport system substrate-binding protein
VVVAASLADVITELGGAFEADGGAGVRLTTGASGVLCEQVIAGATCDLFIPADPAYINRLRLPGDRLDLRATLAANRLAIVVPRNRGSASLVGEKSAGGLESLCDIISSWKRISIANPEHAPAGARAKEALTALELWRSLRDRIVFADDVRMAARYVSEGVVDGGLVYRTDARAFESTVEVIGVLPESLHVPIRYEAVVGPKAVHAAEAERFLKFMQSDEAGKIWRKYGFGLIGSSAGSYEVPRRGE